MCQKTGLHKTHGQRIFFFFLQDIYKQVGVTQKCAGQIREPGDGDGDGGRGGGGVVRDERRLGLNSSSRELCCE